MNIKYLLESGLIERGDIHSGRIYKEGFPPRYGVIFTSTKPVSEDDLGLDVDLILGAYIGHRGVSENDKDQFFEILGGYFYHDNYPEPGITTRIFGIALEPEFGIKEGGTTTLKEKWKLDDPEKPMLDESYWSDTYGKHHGWTFIVTIKEIEKFPLSGDELKIFTYCPEIKHISVEIGKCEYDATGTVLKRKVTYKTLLGETEPKKWTFFFGDGSSESGDGVPPESIDHLYQNKPANEPKLCLQDHTACEEICKQVSLSEFDAFTTCPQCPEIKNIEVTFGEECVTEDKVRRRKVTFTTSIEGDEPDSWTWYFGDGTEKSGDGLPPATIDHYYEKIPDNAPKLCIVGPDPCSDTCKEADMSGFEQCPPCPKIVRIDHEIKDKDLETKTVQFEVVVSDGAPDKIEWDWGDGSPTEMASNTTASHDYKILISGPVQHTVTVKSTGPEDCQDSAQATIEIPQVECPQINEIEVMYGECVTEVGLRRRKVTFTLSVTGEKPDSWTWHFGDGTEKSGDGLPPATIEHYYKKIPDNAPKLCIVGPGPCSETCKEADMTGFKECLPCPEISAIKCESLKRDKQFETFEIKANVSRKPDQFEWDYGDGSPKETTTEPKVRHPYKILDKDSIYTIKVTSRGPEDCKDTMQETLTVERGAIVSRFCVWLHLLVAFLLATTFGTLIVYFAAKLFGQQPDYNWMLSVAILLALLSGIFIILWYRFVRRKLCPRPGKCHWLSIGWIVSLAGMLIAYYVSTICTAWWWVVIIILLIIAGLLLFRWYRKCIVKIKDIFVYLCVCLLAVLFVYFLIAYTLFESY